MKHTDKELTDLWDIWSQPAKKNESFQAENAGHAAPKVVYDDKVAQVLSLSSTDGSTRYIYARKPGGIWVMLP